MSDYVVRIKDQKVVKTRKGVDGEIFNKMQSYLENKGIKFNKRAFDEYVYTRGLDLVLQESVDYMWEKKIEDGRKHLIEQRQDTPQDQPITRNEVVDILNKKGFTEFAKLVAAEGEGADIIEDAKHVN